MYRIFIGLLGLTVIAACSTITSYQPVEAGKRYGYSDFQIDQTHFKVSFSGNALTSRQLVEANLLYRSAELTLQRGYDYFILSGKEVDKETDYISSGISQPPFPGYYWNPYHSFYQPYYGRYDPFWSVQTREVIRYTASADIELRLGEKKPDERNAYLAREVLQNLDKKILKPKKP